MQAAIVVAEAKSFKFDWRLPWSDESLFFLQNPDAAYMLRPWRDDEDRHGHQHAKTFDMDGITLVFRAGAREPRFYATRGEAAWRRAMADADWFLEECPELGVDGDRALTRLHA